MRVTRQAALALVLPVVFAAVAAAQGVQTGELIGTVKSSDGLTLPGATITAQSPALQGVQTVVSDENGAYALRALPPGPYQVTFELGSREASAPTSRTTHGRSKRHARRTPASSALTS